MFEATIASVQAQMASGEITCRQLTEWYLSRIDAFDRTGPDLRAIQTINQRALDEADERDARRRAGGPLGSMHGIPVVVKDQVETSDMVTTYGSALFRDFVPKRDATVVQRLRAAGAVILAKATMGEFAAGFSGTAFGVCRNAYDPTRDPSGSSSGSGVAVAANFAMVSVGEDTLGSIRGPAARGSLVGLRPTLPLVSRFGMMPAAPTRDTLGPIARTVADTCRLLDVLAGYDPNDPVTAASVGHVPETYTSFLVPDALKGMRFGVIREVMAKDTNLQADDAQQVRGAIDRAVADLAAAGAEIVDPARVESLFEILEQVTPGNYEAEESSNAYLAEHANAPVKTLAEIVLSGEVLPSRRWRLVESLGRSTHDLGFLRHLQMRETLRQAVLKTMADHRLDALLYATFDHDPSPIPEDYMTRKQITQLGNNRALAPMLGFPALVVPAGFTAAGLPVGLEFLGRPFTEGVLFRAGFGYEESTHHRKPPAATPAT